MSLENQSSLFFETREKLKDLCFMVGRSIPHARMERLSSSQKPLELEFQNPNYINEGSSSLIRVLRANLRKSILTNLSNRRNQVDSKKLKEFHDIDSLLQNLEINQQRLEIHKTYSTAAIAVLISMLLVAIGNK
jgi:hypothetical protein